MNNDQNSNQNEKIETLDFEISSNLNSETQNINESIDQNVSNEKTENKTNSNEFMKKITDKVKKEMDTKESNEQFDKNDIEKNKIMAVLSYIIPFIPYFLVKNSKWVKYHSTQGMNLLIIVLIYAIVNFFVIGVINIGLVSFAFGLVGGLLAIIAIIGIVNVLNNKAKPLPIIEKFTFIK